MSDTYTKLFSSITASTIWQEPAATRLVWITMLAMCDKGGAVYASVPGLAHIANVSLPDCETALTTLLSPDKYSRTPSFEGRRIEPIDGGWQLLNHAKFRAVRSAEERREYMRDYMRDKRAKEAEPLTDPLAKLAQSTDVTPPTPTPLDQKQDQEKKHSAAKRGSRIPPSFLPSAESISWARVARPDLDLGEVTAAFVDYWESESGAKASKLDWDKTWKNWVRRSRREFNANRSTSSKPSAVERIAQNIAANRAARESAIIEGELADP